MKTVIRSGFAIALFLLSAGRSTAQDVLQYVDPNIGTAHSRWFLHPCGGALWHG
ncbi:hypothetical protein [Mucilaginibacter antarcticus]|uniref:hypothetical protein n=1 Tax=Mucilaginibacter antarcticus TaxID=1855725 RepID=UPI003629EBDA